MARSCYRKRNNRKFTVAKTVALFLLLFLILGYGAYYEATVIRPSINEIAEIRSKSMINAVVYEVIHNEFQQDIDINDLLIIRTNNEGDIELVQANTPAMNLLVSNMSKELQIRYKAMDATIIRVPIGSILGSQILSLSGPYINLKILPINVSKVDFKTEFIAEGINQTKYKVYAILQSNAKVVSPFSSGTLQTESTILIAEAVIMGKVPSSYVVVPKDNFIDGMAL